MDRTDDFEALRAADIPQQRSLMDLAASLSLCW